jgi:hypothetical protein
MHDIQKKFKLRYPKCNLRCGCGRLLEEHNNDIIETYEKNKSEIIENQKWDPIECTSGIEDTDCYGEIRFNNNKESITSKVFFLFKKIKFI